MRPYRALILSALTLAGPVACATAGPTSLPTPPSYAPVETTPASFRGHLYTDCIAEAVAIGAFAEAHNEDSDLILFTCRGSVAQDFYEGLAAHSAEVGSEFAVEGRTYRSTNPVVANLFGVDYCSTGPETGFICVITLNAGDFIRPGTE